MSLCIFLLFLFPVFSFLPAHLPNLCGPVTGGESSSSRTHGHSEDPSKRPSESSAHHLRIIRKGGCLDDPERSHLSKHDRWYGCFPFCNTSKEGRNLRGGCRWAKPRWLQRDPLNPSLQVPATSPSETRSPSPQQTCS